MQLGKFELTTVSGGRFHIDGGTMFGVVPRMLWSRTFPPDERGNIEQETNCTLLRIGDRTILIDTGYGSKLSDKERKIFASAEGDPLVQSLAAVGVTVGDVDTVILSHLHFDHAGGATRHNEEGTLEPTFPNAEYVAQRGEWEIATADLPELRGAYPQQNLHPLQESGQLRLVEGDVEILPGMRAIVTGGHTQFHQAIVIESAGETAVFLGDLCPTSRHLPTLWCMAYDVDLLQTRRNKPAVLGRVADEDWLALLDHDPDCVAMRLTRDTHRDFAVVESFDQL